MKARYSLLLSLMALALLLTGLAPLPLALRAEEMASLYLPLLTAPIPPPPPGTTIRVSVASDGAEGNVGSRTPSISADGRFVAFASMASNLVEGDDNNFPSCFDANCEDVFVHDLLTGETTLVSIASNGTQGNSGSGTPSISANGRYVAFHSSASNLVAGDTNDLCYAYGHGYLNCSDIFVHDRETGETTRVSVASDGTQANGDSFAPSISANGRLISFTSRATNLLAGCTDDWIWQVFVHDSQTRETTRVPPQGDASGCFAGSGATISEDGRSIAFSNLSQTLIYDRQTGVMTVASVASDGTPGSGSSYGTSISADGRFVAFESAASNLVPVDTNAECGSWYPNYWQCPEVFVHDRHTGETTRVAVSVYGSEANHGSSEASISADGRFVAFFSLATNLVPGDTNESGDIFVYDRGIP